MKQPVLFVVLCASVWAARPPAFVEQPSVTANPNPSVPLAAVLKFSAGQPVQTSIDITDGKNSWTLRYDASKKPEAGLPVVGMRPNRKHTLRVSIRDAHGRTAAAAKALEYTTPPLPTDPGEFPPLKVTVKNAERMEPGYTLFNPRRSRGRDLAWGAKFGMMLIVDAAGEPVWYYRTNSRITQQTIRRNGNIVYMTQDFRLVEIDRLGNVLAQWYAAKRPDGPAAGALPVDTLAFHHSVQEMPSGNLLTIGLELKPIDNYFTSDTDPNAPRKRQNVAGDEVVEFDANGKVVWRWKAFEYLDPYRIGYGSMGPYWKVRGFPDAVDWCHANKIAYDASDDSVLVSFRFLSAVVKVDRKTQQIKWILGEPGGWRPDLAAKLLRLEGDRWFWHQHAVMPTDRGTVLIFDNGNLRARPYDPPAKAAETYSRAVEYAIDEKANVAKEMWVSEGPDKNAVLSVAMGDVHLLPKKNNVLVHYGSVLPPAMRETASANTVANGGGDGWTLIREFTHTTPAELVWELVMGDPSPDAAIGWVLFGGTRMASLE